MATGTIIIIRDGGTVLNTDGGCEVCTCGKRG